MASKLFLFTGITFLLFFGGGIAWHLLNMGSLFGFFIVGSILFAGSNFAYYYAVLVKGTKVVKPPIISPLKKREFTADVLNRRYSVSKKR